MNDLSFTVYLRPEPQGSSKAFVIPGTNRASVTSANPKMKPFRSEVTRMAIASLEGEAPLFPKHTPVKVQVEFGFMRPPSAKKSRTHPVVKPDIDKLQRAILDALTGVAFADDAQVVHITANKVYSPQDMVAVYVSGI